MLVPAAPRPSRLSATPPVFFFTNRTLLTSTLVDSSVLVRTSADVRVGDGPSRVVVEERFALLAVVSHRVVLTVVADAAARTASRLVDGRVEVTARGVTVALAS